MLWALITVVHVHIHGQLLVIVGVHVCGQLVAVVHSHHACGDLSPFMFMGSCWSCGYCGQSSLFVVVEHWWWSGVVFVTFCVCYKCYNKTPAYIY